jgi:short-subunit dehydrogenase
VGQSAVIIGASSGIGAGLARNLARQGYTLGLVARREENLRILAASIPTTTFTRVADIAECNSAMEVLGDLLQDMGGVDLVIITAAIGHENPDLAWRPEAETIAVNVTGFTAMAGVAMRHFLARGNGHLVGISSIASIKADGSAPAYGASKAFVARYLQALRHKVAKQKLPIHVTDIQAGFVDTTLAKGDGLFWIAPVDVACEQILRAIRRRHKHAYVTKRWRLIAWLLRLLPEWAYNRL